MAIVTKNSGSSSLLKGTLNDIGKLMGRGMPRPKVVVTSLSNNTGKLMSSDPIARLRPSFSNILFPPMTYKSKLLFNFLALFAIFTALLVIFQYNRERQYKRDVLESRLESYADVVAAEVDKYSLNVNNPQDNTKFQNLAELLPVDLRLTVINRRGKVLSESTGHSVETMDNHIGRSEVQASLRAGSGSDVRYSSTDNREYFYYAKAYGNYIVRVALPYDASVQTLMKADNVFLWFVLMLFPVVLVFLIHISDHVSKSIDGLRAFMRSADRGLVDYDHIKFPRTELGEISHAIMLKYRQLEETGRVVAAERERLMRHFHYFEEGIAIFGPDRQPIYANPRFTQYVNTVLDRPTADLSLLWKAKPFAPVLEFLTLHGGSRPFPEEAPIFRFTVKGGGNTFGVQVLIYSDGGFELSLSDITRAEKNKILKQQMSNNITHELRTPVSSIRGYIETITSCPNLSNERKQYFLEKAHAQVIRLTDLIRDVALITKTEEAADLMPREEVSVAKVIDDVREDLGEKLRDAHMQLFIDLPGNLTLYGNYSLIYSIFRNLMENSVRYAGDGREIHLSCYNLTSEFAYFSFYDTGDGVSEEHLPRLFERFYRVSEGRTRDNGGTGLGLSIVRNAVQFHQGDISVRNRKDGGLEFLFTLKVG